MKSFAYVWNDENVQPYTIQPDGSLSPIGTPVLAPKLGVMEVLGDKLFMLEGKHPGTDDSFFSAYQIEADGTLSLRIREQDVEMNPYVMEATILPGQAGPLWLFIQNADGGIDTYQYAAPDKLERVATATIPGYETNPVHDLFMDHKGRFLYAGADGGVIASFFLTSVGQLTYVDRVLMPNGDDFRCMAIHPSGQFLYVASDLRPNIYLYNVDQGRFPVLGASFPNDLPGDTGIWNMAISPDGKYLYARAFVSKTVNVPGKIIACYAIDQDTGALRKVSETPCEQGQEEDTQLPMALGGKYLYAPSIPNVVCFQVGGDGTLTQKSLTERRGDFMVIADMP